MSFTSFSISTQISIDFEKKIERKVNKELNDATNEAMNTNPTVFELLKDVIIDIKEKESRFENDN